MIYFMNEPHLKIWWDESHEVARAEWHGFLQGQKLRDGLNRTIDFVKMKKATSYLVDLRDFKVITKEDQQWINEDWFPRMMATPLEKMAVIQPASVVAKMSYNQVINKFDNFAVGNFDNESAAVAWLQNSTAVGAATA